MGIWASKRGKIRQDITNKILNLNVYIIYP